MYYQVYLPLDHSVHSMACIDLAIALAIMSGAGARLTGSHVSASQGDDVFLHQATDDWRICDGIRVIGAAASCDTRTYQRKENVLFSPLATFTARCEAAGVQYSVVTLEGTTHEALVLDILSSESDLVVMGTDGGGRVASTRRAGVCDRVAHLIDRDLLIVRESTNRADGNIVVALDGSPQSWAALMIGIQLGMATGEQVEVIAVCDSREHKRKKNKMIKRLFPDSHRYAGLMGQKMLHDEVPDIGLSEIHRVNLETAARLARSRGVEISTTLLSGAVLDQLVAYSRETMPWLLMLGRTGTNISGAMGLGCTARKLLRLTPCNLLLTVHSFNPTREHYVDPANSYPSLQV